MPEVQYHARVSISGWDVTVLILYHIDTIGCQYLENDISFIALHTFSLVNRINRVNVLYNCQCKTFHKLRSFFVTLTSLLQLLMINSKVQPLDVKTLAYEMKKYNCKCYEAAFFSYRQYFFFPGICCPFCRWIRSPWVCFRGRLLFLKPSEASYRRFLCSSVGEVLKLYMLSSKVGFKCKILFF